MASEKDVESLAASVEAYESCVEQLKKELPKYFQSRHHGITTSTSTNLTAAGKDMAAFTKILRNVASLESNSTVQSALFLFAQKTEGLERERLIYSKCQTSAMTLLDVAKTKMVSPAKDIVADMRSVKKKRETLQQQQLKKPLSQSDLETFDSLILHESYMRQSFPIHADIFEEHRIKSIKKLLSMMLYTEMRYHCKVIEELTEVMNKLEEVEDYIQR